MCLNAFASIVSFERNEKGRSAVVVRANIQSASFFARTSAAFVSATALVWAVSAPATSWCSNSAKVDFFVEKFHFISSHFAFY